MKIQLFLLACFLVLMVGCGNNPAMSGDTGDRGDDYDSNGNDNDGVREMLVCAYYPWEYERIELMLKSSQEYRWINDDDDDGVIEGDEYNPAEVLYDTDHICGYVWARSVDDITYQAHLDEGERAENYAVYNYFNEDCRDRQERLTVDGREVDVDPQSWSHHDRPVEGEGCDGELDD